MTAPVCGSLEPENVFRFFEELSAIPRGSGNTAAAADWVERFAAGRGLKRRRDALNNVVIWKEASPGYEDHPPVMLQGHLDMVCVKDPGVSHDFLTDPLELYIDGDWLKARGTSLGGDDGVAVALALAVLDDGAIPHPPLEAVFTADEEIGLLGAGGLEPDGLRSRLLINLDSEDEGVLTCGCAGGARCDLAVDLERAPYDGESCLLSLSGLSGGHSGTAIHLGFANAGRLLAECLRSLGCPRIVSLRGGEQDNAIPNRAEAVVAVERGGASALRQRAAAWAARAKKDCPRDPGFTFTFESGADRGEALTAPASRRAVELILGAPNGVRSMEPDLPDQVRTSLNLGVLRLEGGSLSMTFCIRSSSAGEKAELARELREHIEGCGGRFSQRGDYPPWEYRKDSRLRETMIRVYREQTGREPRVETIHAGLECGILAGKLPGLDAVSLGPDLKEIHSTQERLSIGSVRRLWSFLLGVLKEL